jgi:hypothetical protein
MQTSSSFVTSAECLKPGNSRDIAGLVYEHLCNFRALTIKQRRQRTLQNAGNSDTSHPFTTEAEKATPRKSKRHKSSTADTRPIPPSNNVNPEQRLDSVFEDTTGLELASEDMSLQGADIALQFAIEVVSKLDEKELDSFVHFLTKEDTDHDIMDLQRLLTDEIEHFCTQETDFTKEDIHGIAQPAGKSDCDLGLILHCQSREGGVIKFWD